MYILLISLVIGLFVALLFLNIYFRFKVLRAYRYLVQNQIEFGATHIFNKEKMETEIISRYPQHRQQIQLFCSHLRYSIRMATWLVILITLFGGILMYFR